MLLKCRGGCWAAGGAPGRPGVLVDGRVCSRTACVSTTPPPNASYPVGVRSGFSIKSRASPSPTKRLAREGGMHNPTPRASMVTHSCSLEYRGNGGTRPEFRNPNNNPVIVSATAREGCPWADIPLGKSRFLKKWKSVLGQPNSKCTHGRLDGAAGRAAGIPRPAFPYK